MSFTKFGGICAIVAGVVAFLYAVAFLIISRNNPQVGFQLSSLFLLIQGIAATAAFVGLFQKLQKIEAGFGLWFLLLGVVGAVGAAVHGGFDLANTLNPPSAGLFRGVPSQVDPRGLLTFGVTAIALFIASWLIQKGKELPKGLGTIGYLASLLLLLLYLGRLTVLNPVNPLILWPAIINGFIVYPIWFIWLGTSLWQSK